jgi:8-oxo-dGTP diphosphatase
VVVRAGKVVLIRRGKPPLKGRWTVPGGTVELGESLSQALVREVREETGLVVRPGPALALLDHIRRERGRVRYHFVIVDFLCRHVSGAGQAGSDAVALAWVAPAHLAAYHLTCDLLHVIRAGLRRSGVRAPLLPRRCRRRIVKSILAQ